MNTPEFSDQFDLLYNNITSNQAPGLSEYEKSVFLTKAEKEIVKNYFSPNSKGNNLGQGFDDSAKRQADFSTLMFTKKCESAAIDDLNRIDRRSKGFKYPNDVFIVINESVEADNKILQVIPLRYDEYTRLMSKPFKRPLKNQAWRLINKGEVSGAESVKYVELILNVEDEDKYLWYKVRYVRTPKPIILANLDGLTIDGLGDVTECEIDPILHEDILQRAVELAKIAWTATGNDNTQAVMQAGQRSE